MAKPGSSIEYEQVNNSNLDELDEEESDDILEQDSLIEPSTSYNLTAIQVSDTMDVKNASQDSSLAKSTNHWDKFRLLMWKNFKLQWRHKIQTIVEIAVPVLFNALLVLIRSLVEPEVYSEPTIYEPFHINTLDPLRKGSKFHFDFTFLLRESNNAQQKPPIEEWKLAYSPENVYFEKILTEVSNSLGLDGFFSVSNSTALEAAISNDRIVAGIDFHHPANLTELPRQLAYSLRFPSELRTPPTNLKEPIFFNWRTNLLYPLYFIGGPRSREDNDGGIPWYNREGFLAIQNAVTEAFVKIMSGSEMPEVLLQRFPYPPFTLDILLQGLETILSFVIMVSFVYPCINTVRFIAMEKEKQLKEAMKIMGLPNWLHWTGWFIKTMAYMTISITLIVILLKITWFKGVEVSVLTYSDWSVIWVFLFIFSISTTTFCFMLSVFFSRANTAGAVAGLVWFILYTPFTFTQQNYEQLTLTTKILVSLSSNTAMAYGFQLILRLEGAEEGLNWSNLWRPVTVDDNFPVGMTMVLMLISSLVYLIIALYVEKVLPGSYGVPEKWYFPFTKEFWFGLPEYKGVNDSYQQMNDKSKLNFENDPQNRHAGIQIKNLRKVYDNKKVAVQGLTLNMFDDQITVLLGHNGAGKTTTMSMLTGMFPPTTGTAIINDCDIRTNIIGARDSLGLCPQHNILFDELTVREHIVFYSRLKGLDPAAVEDEVTKYVRLLELEDKIDAQSHTLSGGMKRKLSVGVALCGGSKVVLCDEPSSGMDPAARRALWDLLQSEKKGRTVLLSTHFMDEADVLGDRIAIMADGELKCCGTSFFLKKRFGTGYHLICVKDSGCKSSEVTRLLQQYVPDVEVESEIGSELSYQLPDDHVNQFETMLAELESVGDQLRLSSYGVSLTTLEEVFLKVGTDNAKLDRAINGVNNSNNSLNNNNAVANGHAGFGSNGSVNLESVYDDTTPLLGGFGLIANQWYAMFKKKILHTFRNWLLFFVQNLIPICFVILTILVMKTLQPQSALPPLEISLSTYKKSVTILEKSPSLSDLSAKISTEYEADFRNRPTIGALEVTDDRMENYYLELAKTILIRLNRQYLVGASIGSMENDTIVAWFNNQPFHTAPLAIDLVHNAIVRAMIGSQHSIRVINRPIPFSVDSRMLMLNAGNNIGFQLASNVGFAMAFVGAFYIMFYIKERECKAKLLQFVSGVNVFTFWMTSFLWDFVTFTVTSVLLVITMAIFQEDGWSSPAELARFFTVLMLFGFSMLPMTFIASMFFTVPSSGFVRMTIVNIFSGIAVFFVIFMMSIPSFNLMNLANKLKEVFLVFPHYSLSLSLNNLNVGSTIQRVCNSKCELVPACTPELMCALLPECCKVDYLAWKEPGIGRNLVYMLGSGLAFFLILLIVEYRLLEGFSYLLCSVFKRKLPSDSEDNLLDDDVLAEKQRLSRMSMDEIMSHSLLMRQVSKFYGSFLAVNQISVAIKESECFGLLGANGAGKTSTFKMLTGDEKISSGDAWVRGISLKTNMRDVHQVIGYCPQFDALIEDLTGRETLEMFCLLRGVPRSKINDLSMRLADELNFTKHIDKKVVEYSGGNKRKLSTAVALIGNPIVVYLDEPTTGMDPGAKRNLWNMVCRVRNSGKSIVLTSHSMEECEALCTRLAIMVNGEFKCLGSTQHLKNKFSKGYVLNIKIKKSSEIDFDNKIVNNPILNEIQRHLDEIKDYVKQHFPGSFLKEEYQGLLTYYIPPNNSLKWSKMFGLMELAKTELHIEDYSISQTSLEQVFLSFTKYQKDETKNQNRNFGCSSSFDSLCCINCGTV